MPVLFSLFILLLGGGMLIFGIIPIGMYPFAVKGVSILNIWVRIAGACLLAGFLILQFTEAEYNWLGVGLFMAAPLFIAVSVIKYIGEGGGN